ncbi:hypothetical protein [Aquiflexum sp.]|uniref:hypothetical protein n=1 Tax=Aquiflexum sp. TaxID=1872584 RepID=UPI003593C9AE
MKILKLLAAGILAACLIVLNVIGLYAQTKEKNVTVIELTQTEKQFTTQKLELKPGKYQFRVVNENVSKDLGFVITVVRD